MCRHDKKEIYYNESWYRQECQKNVATSNEFFEDLTLCVGMTKREFIIMRVDTVKNARQKNVATSNKFFEDPTHYFIAWIYFFIILI